MVSRQGQESIHPSIDSIERFEEGRIVGFAILEAALSMLTPEEKIRLILQPESREGFLSVLEAAIEAIRTHEVDPYDMRSLEQQIIDTINSTRHKSEDVQ